ncbi:MAG: drug/metabolite transporter (DMT)-like permease [Ilumatobacter sp.]|jgi:drug/metabolite transporter (DMT)-like permease
MTKVAVEPAASRRTMRLGLAASAGGFWLVSIAPVIVAGSEVHGLVMAFWRSWIGFAVLGLILTAKRQLTWQVFRATAPMGFSFGLSIGFFFWASQITSIANASLITVLQPVPLLLAAHLLFNEKLTGRDISFAALAIVGAIFLVLAGQSEGTGDIRGDLLAFASILAGGGYFVFGKRLRETMSVLAVMAGMFAWAGIVMTPFVVISGERVLARGGDAWLEVFAVAIIPGIGHLLLNASHGRAPLNLMSVLILLVPVNATLLAYFFLDQRVSVLQIVGGATVIAAITIQSLLGSNKPADLPVSSDGKSELSLGLVDDT